MFLVRHAPGSRYDVNAQASREVPGRVCTVMQGGQTGGPGFQVTHLAGTPGPGVNKKRLHLGAFCTMALANYFLAGAFAFFAGALAAAFGAATALAATGAAAVFNAAR